MSDPNAGSAANPQPGGSQPGAGAPHPGAPNVPPPGWNPNAPTAAWHPDQPAGPGQPGQPGGPAQPGQPWQQPGQPGQPGSQPWQQPGPPPSPARSGVGFATFCSLVAIAATAAAVSFEEDGDNGWGRIGVWAGFAIAAAAATGVPAIRSSLNLDRTRAWQVAVGGAVALAAFWVLFVLPSIEQNVSFVATVGAAAGGLAAWSSEGRPGGPPTGGQTW